MTYYLWVGDRATFGQPHPITGLYSRFGTVKAFNTKKEAYDYLWGHPYDNCKVSFITRSRKKLRKYHQGMTMDSFNKMLDCLLTN